MFAMRLSLGLSLGLSALPASAQTLPAAEGREFSAIDMVWSGFETKFAIVEGTERLFVGYYDAMRQLSLAVRVKGGPSWHICKLQNWLGWDSHNGIAMALDPAGQLHIAANMHVDPLAYWKTTIVGDPCSAERVPSLGQPDLEQAATYPAFFQDAQGTLIFRYRDGMSGNGNEIYSAYNEETGTFRPLHTTPLVDGEGARNAYFAGPKLGPDGMFHLVWVWRDTPDAATNHDLSYARSPDLVRWERSNGTPIDLPITFDKAEIVDPVPVHGGMINGNTIPGFDSQNRIVIAYHKFDDAGNTQVYVARPFEGGWQIEQVTDWQDFRWDFSGGGTLESSRVNIGEVHPFGERALLLPVLKDRQAQMIYLDEETLRPISRPAADQPASPQPKGPRISELLQPPAGMELQMVQEQWSGNVPAYRLYWFARPANRDRPSFDIPAPSELRLAAPVQPQ